RPVEVRARLETAPGARVTAMNVTVGRRALYTYRQDASTARRSYEQTQLVSSDPALLEMVGTNQLQVRVWPLSRATSAHVELTIEAPRERSGYDLSVDYVSSDRSLVAL